MPSIHIKALPQENPDSISNILTTICANVAEIAKVPTFGVHVTWEEISPERYGEAGSCPKTQPADTHPPVVELLMYEGRTDKQISDALEAIAEQLITGLKLGKGNAFVSFREVKSGHVYTGGSIKRN